jgi:hypothetical protein
MGLRIIALGIVLAIGPAFAAETIGPGSTASVPRSCCKVCSKGKPCGNSCIAATKTCTKPPGCAC